MSEWTKIDEQIQHPPPTPNDTPSQSTDNQIQRPMTVTAIAAYQWLKAALFLQLFWKLWSAHSHPVAASDLASSIGPQRGFAVYFLLGVAFYLTALGWGLWNLRKWALLLLLVILLPDVAYDLRLESFGLEHVGSFLSGDQALLLFIGISLADATAFASLLNPTTIRAFGAEEEAELLERLRWWV